MADLRSLVAGFVIEAQEICEAVTRDVLVLERATADDSALAAMHERVARGLHTLKGTSATLELDGPSTIAHALENMLAPRRGQPLGSKLAGDLLSGLDRYMGLLREAAGPSEGAASSRSSPSTADAAAAEGGWRVQGREVLALMRDIERLRELHQRLAEHRKTLELVAAALPRTDRAETAEARELLAGLARALKADVADAGDIVDELEGGVKTICTEPVRAALQPLQRAVRDLCAAQGKEARLSTLGGDLSIDRRVVEALKAPLVHLVRNAVDHGVEPPDEREQIGKHREASIVVRVEQQGNLVFVELSDDGRGLEPQTLREAARRAGMTNSEVAALDDASLAQLIFRPGFSTRSVVSETSGRGVGLDVVKTALQSLAGRVEVYSKAGEGTRFTLTIPADLGSSPVLLVRAAEHVLGVPLLAVSSVNAARDDDVRVQNGGATWRHDDVTMPLHDLGALLGVRQPEVAAAGQPVLRLESASGPFALLVDEVLGDADLVVRPLPSELSELRAYQGAATLAHGELVLVVRPDWLADDGARAHRAGAGVRRALVVDDSLTARALHRSMLEAGGFIVHAVAGARQALAQLHKAAYDVVICDIQMPDMDGFAFAAAARASSPAGGAGPRATAPPIVLVTAHKDEAHRARAAEVGADGFLTKRECAAGGLLVEVQRALVKRAPA